MPSKIISVFGVLLFTIFYDSNRSESDSKPRKVNLIRCAYCHGFIEIRLNKKEKKRNATESPVRKADGFTMFVKERYDLLKAPDDSNVKIMQTLNEEYSQLSTVK